MVPFQPKELGQKEEENYGTLPYKLGGGGGMGGELCNQLAFSLLKKVYFIMLAVILLIAWLCGLNAFWSTDLKKYTGKGKFDFTGYFGLEYTYSGHKARQLTISEGDQQ